MELTRAVAKHYMTSRASFDETARYWAEIYAGAPPRGEGGARLVGKEQDEIAIAGLERPHVERFVNMGFDKTKVVRTAWRGTYSGG